MNNGIGVPVVRISGFRTWGVNALSPLIGSRVERLFLLQDLGDLHRPTAFHAKAENVLDHLRRCFVHNPSGLVIRVFEIPKRNIGS